MQEREEERNKERKEERNNKMMNSMHNNLRADDGIPLILLLKRHCSEYFKCHFDNECIADTNIALIRTS